MSDLNLYRVIVTQEWSAEAEALVWATSQKEAEKAAELEVEIDEYDMDKITWGRGKAESLETIHQLTPQQAAQLWLIDPKGNTVDLEDFQAVLTPEQLEAMRLARIDAGNGQLALLEVEGCAST
jgi:hypothetical protein